MQEGSEFQEETLMRRWLAAPRETGLALVELVSPGHGLRRADHLYCGESFFQSAPVSAGASLAAKVRATGRWIAWARQAFNLPVGVFGLSMSSFVAQLAISHCSAWTEAARPDAALLMAHSGDLIGVTQGSLSRGVGLPAAQTAAGWAAAGFCALRLGSRASG